MGGTQWLPDRPCPSYIYIIAYIRIQDSLIMPHEWQKKIVLTKKCMQESQPCLDRMTSRIMDLAYWFDINSRTLAESSKAWVGG